MTHREFHVEGWVNRLVTELSVLAKAQVQYLEMYWRRFPQTYKIVDDKDVTPFPPGRLAGGLPDGA